MKREGMTVTELAETVGMTARNIRAYQSKGLLESPQIHGRVAHYSGVHVARLLLIASLQREGFTLAAIKRLLDSPDSYAAIVADRRRRFRDDDSDISPTIRVSEARIRELFPSAPDDLTSTGLVWRDDEGELVSHTTIVGVGRTLLTLGVPADVVAALQLDAVSSGRAMGRAFRAGTRPSHDARDAARVAVQLCATAFEVAFLAAATEPSDSSPPDSTPPDSTPPDSTPPDA